MSSYIAKNYSEAIANLNCISLYWFYLLLFLFFFVGFLTHMVETLARHGRFDIELYAEGDVHVSHHHTVEDVGIVLGKSLP